jgi:phosphatidylglycerophosphatase A
MVDDVVAAIMALVCLYLIDLWIMPQVFS